MSGFIEKPNLATPTRRDQYVFINGRPATAPSIAYAIREAYPRRQGDTKPAAIIFIELPANQVDVNVHPTKREVRFRDNVAVKQAIIESIDRALAPGVPSRVIESTVSKVAEDSCLPRPASPAQNICPPKRGGLESSATKIAPPPPPAPLPVRPAPIEIDLPLAAEEGETAKPWNWFKFLAMTASGYLLIETDTGVVTINPHAARERIAFEALLDAPQHADTAVQTLLIPEIIKLSPPDFARVKASLAAITAMGFAIEEFGNDTYKVDAVPQLLGELSPATILQTIARDLADGSGRRGGDRWREELIAKSIAKSFAGMNLNLTEDGAVKLVEELAATRMPYVCPRGKPIMIFTSTRELDRKFNR